LRLREWLRSFVEDAKAFRRGEKRVAPRHARGRIYVKRSDGTQRSLAPGEASVKIVHTRAADGTQTIHTVK